MSHAQLFTPFRVAGVELPIWIVIASICQYSANDGLACDTSESAGTFRLSGAADDRSTGGAARRTHLTA